MSHRSCHPYPWWQRQSGTTIPTLFVSPIAWNLHQPIPTPAAAATPSEMAAMPPPPRPRPGSGCRPCCEVRILVPPRPQSGRPWTGGAGSPSPGAPWRCLRRRPCPGVGPVAASPSFWCRYCIDCRTRGSWFSWYDDGHGNIMAREFGAGTSQRTSRVSARHLFSSKTLLPKTFHGGLVMMTCSKVRKNDTDRVTAYRYLVTRSREPARAESKREWRYRYSNLCGAVAQQIPGKRPVDDRLRSLQWCCADSLRQ